MISFRNVAIVGVGLIGGSLALAARRHGTFQQIAGVDVNPDTIAKAESLGVIDWGTRNLQQGVKEADLVVVATPVRSIAPLVAEIAPNVRPGTIITDAGSVKAEIVSTVEAMRLDDVSFVGGHPIAGTENSGVEAAFADLFSGKNCVLTPTVRTSPSSLERVQQVWESTGAQVICMDTQVHDRVFGAVSHLPHYVAFALVTCIANLASDGEDFFRFSAGGLKDFTRIAGSDPVMWTDIAHMNRANIVRFIDNYQEYLNKLRQLITDGDSEGLLGQISKARSIRRNRMG